MDDPGLLTKEEHEFLKLTGEVASRLRAIIGDGPNAATDWNEVAGSIHTIQHAVMRQAGARAYPDRYRLLGQAF